MSEFEEGVELLILAQVSKDRNPQRERKPGSTPVYVACAVSSY